MTVEPTSFDIYTSILSNSSGENLYLDLMKSCLLNSIYQDDKYNELKRHTGRDWPLKAHTMIGRKRLNNIQYCVEKTIKDKIPGDLIETGVWRGGATIFMRAILKVYNVKDKKVWVADSFEGLPPPDLHNYPQDKGLDLYTFKNLAVSLDTVKENFKRYNLLDNQVIFLKGWFKDTLPQAPINKLSVLRLDGDLYESTLEALKYLYPKLSIGGYVIIDDYGAIKPCRQAVNYYRKHNKIREPIFSIDHTGIYWRKTS